MMAIIRKVMDVILFVFHKEIISVMRQVVPFVAMELKIMEKIVMMEIKIIMMVVRMIVEFRI